MKTILLPTDFSENSKNAIYYAIELYGQQESKFLLATAYEVPQAGASMLVSIEDELLKIAKKNLKELQEEIKEKYSPSTLSIETMAIYGSPVTAVKKLLNSERIDVIVMGTKGASGLKEVVLGSNTASVIMNVNCPVLAIPEEASYRKLSKIGYATDFSEFNDQFIMDPMLELAEQEGATIKVFHVGEKNEEPILSGSDPASAMESIHYHIQRVPYDFVRVENNDVEHGVEMVIEKEKLDMLAMVTQKRAFLQKILHRSLAKKLAMHTKVPLLVLHDN